jgi:hypothetical protein
MAVITWEVYDLECLANVFTYTGYVPKEKKYYQYVIAPWRNDIEDLYNHLFREKLIMVGFNNLSYDYPLLHHIINHYNEYKKQYGKDIAPALYIKSQDIINQEFSVIADKNTFIRQLDLYKIFHYNNKARMTSLKDLEVAMCLPNVEEMPIKHTTFCTQEQEESILAYNKNDVYATYMFLLTALGKTDYIVYKGKNKIDLRVKLNNKFKIPCLNWPDVKIGEQLIIKLYCDKMGISSYELKNKGGTHRDIIHLKDCIPHWANFETKEFNEIKNKFANTDISNIKGAFEASVNFHGITIDYGTGGAHSSAEPGIYSADDYWTILDEDIGSLYPSIAIQLGIYPEHLGKEFLNIYNEDIVSVRLSEKKKPKKERDMVIMEGYKLAANGIVFNKF